MQYQELGAQILGISYDAPADNRAWSELMGFEFPLLSDMDRSIGARLEVERPPDDRLYGAPRRTTYLIDPDLVIHRSYLVAREEINEHTARVLADLREATAGPTGVS